MPIIFPINNNDNPIEFQTNFYFKNLEINYINLMEINQGSPCVGNLLINKNNFFKETLFGGPFLYDDKYHLIYIPVFIRKFCVVGFKLSVIDLKRNSLSYLGKIEPLIFLKELNNSYIYFYKDIMKNIESVIKV